MKLFRQSRERPIGFRPEVLTGRLPPALREAARAAGISEADVLTSVQAIWTLEGRHGEVWLVITRDAAVALAAGTAPGAAVISGPFKLADAVKARAFQTVGSMFLQLLVDGMYVDVIRFSNGCREIFGRVQIQLERRLNGLSFDAASLARPSETVCSVCGLPLPGRKAVCPRCAGSRGIFSARCCS